MLNICLFLGGEGEIVLLVKIVFRTFNMRITFERNYLFIYR